MKPWAGLELLNPLPTMPSQVSLDLHWYHLVWYTGRQRTLTVLRRLRFRLALNFLGHRWPYAFLLRFNEMKKYIGSISYKALSSTLKELEADGLIYGRNIRRYRRRWNTV